MQSVDERRRPRRCGSARTQGGTGPHYIFISYRWKDSFAHVQLLADGLITRFGRARVFLDTREIRAGDEIDEKIKEAIRRADQFLLVIGDRWLASGPGGTSQLDNPKDWVRQEMEMARAENLRLIPVLVHDASMPRPESLPETLRWVTYRNAETLHNSQLQQDLAGLAERLHKRRPRNRFASLEELRTLAPLRALFLHASWKLCSIAFAVAIASISIWRSPVFIAIGAAAYLLLTINSFFTLAEAEWVGSRDAEKRTEHPPESTITSS